MQGLAVICFGYSAAVGYAACVRARSCTYRAHWVGTLAVAAMAVLAWPQDDAASQSAAIQSIQAEHDFGNALLALWKSNMHQRMEVRREQNGRGTTLAGH